MCRAVSRLGFLLNWWLMCGKCLLLWCKNIIFHGRAVNTLNSDWSHNHQDFRLDFFETWLPEDLISHLLRLSKSIEVSCFDPVKSHKKKQKTASQLKYLFIGLSCVKVIITVIQLWKECRNVATLLWSAFRPARLAIFLWRFVTWTCPRGLKGSTECWQKSIFSLYFCKSDLYQLCADMYCFQEIAICSTLTKPSPSCFTANHINEINST